MKKLIVALLAICIAFSCFGVVAFAEEATGDATTAKVEKNFDTLVGTFYLQGESGYNYIEDGEFTTDYDYSIAAYLEKILTGTNRIPFYAYEKNGNVWLDRFSKSAFTSEMNLAKSAGIDFIAYKYYAGFGMLNNAKVGLTYMDNQLKLHATSYGIDTDVKFAIMLDGDYAPAKEADLVIDNYLVVAGYLTATDGRPVVFIEWNSTIAEQITKTNTKLKKAVADGANEKKKSSPKTQLNDDVQAMYVVAVNAPSYAEAIAAGCDAVTYTEGIATNGEAYTAMTAKTEAKWADGDKVVPNVVTGLDKRALAANPIEVTMKKYYNDKKTSVRYTRTATADQYAAAATADEFTAHLNNAVATTNKPAEFNALMVYAWDDFAGGATLCPTKTDTQYQYDSTLLKALKSAVVKDDKAETFATIEFVGAEGFTIQVAYDGNYKKLDANGAVVESSIKYEVATDEPAATEPAGEGEATNAPAATAEADNSKKNENSNIGLIIGIAAAVVVVAVVVVVVIVASKKKKA